MNKTQKVILKSDVNPLGEEAKPVPDLTVADLYNRLLFVAPALAKKELVPHLTDFCFRSGNVIAYNDLFAAETEADESLTGCIRGSELLTLLGSLPQSAELKIKPEKEAITFTCGKASAKLPVEMWRFPFTMPAKPKQGAFLDLSEPLLNAFEMVMVSTTPSGILTGVSAVVLRPQDGLIFATDNLSISVVHGLEFDKPKSLPETIALPAAFITVLLAAVKAPGGTLHLGLKAGATQSEGVLAALPSGWLFSKIVPEAEIYDILPHTDKLDALGEKFGWMSIPDGFVDAVKRCQIFAKKDLTLSNRLPEELVLSAESPHGKFKQKFEVKRKKAFDAFDVAVDPTLLLRSIGYAESICVTPDAVLLAAEGYNGYISSLSKE